MSKGVVLSLFDKSGIMVQPWVDRGYDAIIVDIEHDGFACQNGVTRIGADLRSWIPPRWVVKSNVVFLSAFPPCDHLAVSGARWFKGKGLGALAHSIQLFERAAFWAEYFDAPYLIENPVSTISTYWRKPDHTFHPSNYAGLNPDDHYTKKTCLWVGNGFAMPDLCPLETDIHPDDRIHKAPPGSTRKDFRSATPLGFAKAVCLTNLPPLKGEEE